MNQLLNRNKEENIIKDALINFEENKQNLLTKRGIYLYGSPGSGKTEFINKILKDLNYDIIKFDAGDVRNKSIIETSKDSKGKPESFKMILKVKFLFENKNNFLTERTISKEFSYKNKDNKFDLSLYEEKIEKNLIDKIIEELNIYMNL